MAYTFPPDVGELLQQQLALGDYASEDDVLRDALTALAERREVLAEIRAGIDEMESGGGRPLEEIDKDLRTKYNIPRDA